MKVVQPALGIRFDIDKVNSADYGDACWRIFWRAVDVTRLAGATLYEGDSVATLGGRENVNCLAVQIADEAKLAAIQAALEADPGYLQVAAEPKFVEAAVLCREPLPEAGRVDASGTLSGGYNARHALEAVRRASAQTAGVPAIVTTSIESSDEVHEEPSAALDDTQPIAPEPQAAAPVAVGEQPVTPAPVPGSRRLDFIIGRSPMTVDDATFTVQRSQLHAGTVSLSLDALRLAYMFFPEEYKWRFITPSEYQHRYLNLDALSEDDYAALQTGIATQHHVLTDRCHFVLADYGGQVLVVSLKDLRASDIDLLQELRLWQAERNAQRTVWQQQTSSVTIGASAGSLRGDISLNAAGVASGSRTIPWSALEKVEITRYRALWETYFFKFTPTKASRLQGITTGVAPRLTEACLAEFDFWRTLVSQPYLAVAPITKTAPAILPAVAATAPAPPVSPVADPMPVQPSQPAPRRTVNAVLLASTVPVLAICLIAAMLLFITRPDTQPPGQAKATKAPALAIPGSTNTSVSTGNNAPTQPVFVGANPIIALAAGPDDTLYAVTTENELLKISPDGKPETLHVSQESCGFSFSSVAVVGESPNN